MKTKKRKAVEEFLKWEFKGFPLGAPLILEHGPEGECTCGEHPATAHMVAVSTDTIFKLLEQFKFMEDKAVWNRSDMH